MLLAALLGWLEREQRDVIAFLREENRVLKAQLGSRRLRLNDDQRRRLAVLGQRLGRGPLREVARSSRQTRFSGCASPIFQPSAIHPRRRSRGRPNEDGCRQDDA